MRWGVNESILKVMLLIHVFLVLAYQHIPEQLYLALPVRGVYLQFPAKQLLRLLFQIPNLLLEVGVAAELIPVSVLFKQRLFLFATSVLLKFCRRIPLLVPLSLVDFILQIREDIHYLSADPFVVPLRAGGLNPQE